MSDSKACAETTSMSQQSRNRSTTLKSLVPSRLTIWRMTKDGLLHPVEILPGTCRYSRREVAALALHGMNGGVAGRREVSAA
jgi:hypothetical protein